MHAQMLRILSDALLCACILLPAASCDGSDDPGATPQPTAAPPTIELRYDGGALRVELAITPEERARGLMDRASLADDAGMLFVYEAPRIPSFWMKNTLIPLDLIWIGEDKRIAAVTADVQPEPGVADGQLRRYRPDVPVRYVLEVSAGTAQRLGLSPGVRLAFDLPPE